MNYPFVHCLDPKRIVNPYTHEPMVVPCGHCKACVANRHQRLTFQCKLESVTYGSPLFVTLTYRNTCIPRADFFESTSPLGDEYDTEIGTYDLFDSETGEILSDSSLSQSDVEKLKSKFHLFGSCPYLRKSDLVKFIKRLRYYVSKNFSSIKLRYFAVGEYGPVHLRPHYHLLLWCSDPKAKSDLANYIYQAWPFGRIDCQLSEGDSAKYVAGYLNAYSTLPKVLMSLKMRPFVLHSIRLGQGFLEGEREKVYQTSPTEFIKRSLVFDGKVREFNLWRSCYAYFFPKCRGFARLSQYRLFATYSLYKSLSSIFDAASLKEYAEILATLVSSYHSEPDQLKLILSHYDCSQSYYKTYLEPALEFLAEDQDFSAIGNSYEAFNRLVTRCYLDLHLSWHFLTYCCDSKASKLDSHVHLLVSNQEINHKIQLIQEFYKTLDYNNLTSFYESQKLYYEQDLIGDEDIYHVNDENSIVPYFYNNIQHDVTLCASFRQYRFEVLENYNKNIKHKKLNDLNQLLFSD